jgi:hypothetical protein
VQEYVAACFEVFGPGVFDFVVADAILAWHENHRGRGNARDIYGVMARATDDIAVRITKHLSRAAYGIDAVRIEMRCGKLNYLSQFALEMQPRRDICGDAVQLAIHRREILVFGVAHVDAHRDAAGNNVARVRIDLHESYSRATIGGMP